MNTYKKGKISENKAINFLKSKNYKIIEQNFFCKGGEIDIIAFKEGTFHFIEVKSGNNFEPIYNVTPQKIKRIIKCINHYLKKHKINAPFCLDVITIKNDKIEFLKNVTI